MSTHQNCREDPYPQFVYDLSQRQYVSLDFYLGATRLVHAKIKMCHNSNCEVCMFCDDVCFCDKETKDEYMASTAKHFVEPYKKHGIQIKAINRKLIIGKKNSKPWVLPVAQALNCPKAVYTALENFEKVTSVKDWLESTCRSRNCRHRLLIIQPN